MPSGLSPAEAERLIVEREPARPSTATERPAAVERSTATVAWGDLDVLCLTAMHKDPARRYRSADALIRDLDHYLAGEPLDAQPDRLGYRLAKFVRRNRPAVTAAVAIVMTVLALVGFYTARLTTARNQAEAEAVRTQRIQRFVLDLFQGGDQEAGPADSLRVIELLDRACARPASSTPSRRRRRRCSRPSAGSTSSWASWSGRTRCCRRRWRGGRRPPRTTRCSPRASFSRWPRSGSTRRGSTTASASPEPGSIVSRGSGPTTPTSDGPTPCSARCSRSVATIQRPSPCWSWRCRLERRSDEPDADPGGAALTELGNSHFYAGNFEIADSLFRSVLALDRRLHGPRHPLVANDLINVGAVLHERGRYGDAEDAYREALALNRDFYGWATPRSRRTSPCWGGPALPAEAGRGARRPHRGGRHPGGRVRPNHPVVASTVNELGSVALMGDRLDEAERAYRRMAGICRAAYPDGHFAIGVAVSNLASVLLNRDHRGGGAALPGIGDGLQRRAQSPDHLKYGHRPHQARSDAAPQQPSRRPSSRSRYDIVAAQADPGV
ncbi:MAG: tetratricopeptide repeat protein [Gemmatimonadales bacterium]